ncbi:uncharacterized protein LOC122665792 [Telopea speciosissima]|uniref:uncharacterized protein LOC122665791 n=1 Tax=Telopea speciosissima TaxID=54955 RepID=UPI001CC6F6CF|nr:uncharacterized protein LOC122665791 [Telopea speciosissima]XP_043717863.1 uncharacterized protein LOC122665792 [Telopea speciosissima]
MTTTELFHISDMEQQQQPPPYPPKPRRSCALRWILIFLPIFILLLLIILILSFTVFKAKDPTTQVVSVTVDGVSPEVILPQFKVELNITLNLQILVHNPNHASFKHGPGTTVVYYNGTQVAVGDISPGTVPATGSETFANKLNLQADRFVSEISELISDLMAGEFEVETKSTVPGRVKFLGIFHKHVVSLSDCRIVIGISNLKVRSQECNNKIKF